MNTLEELKKYFGQYVHISQNGESINLFIDFKRLLDCTADALIQMWYNWRNQNNVGRDEMEASAQCMFQMIVLELKSIQKLSEVTTLKVSGVDCHVRDITSMQNVLRTIYETVTLFYYIYVKTENIDERKIMFLIWRIKGMNNRQSLVFVPSKYKKQFEKEKQDIEKDKKLTKSLAKTLNMDPHAYKSLCSIVDNKSNNVCGFEFVKNPKGKIIEFSKRSFGSRYQSEEILGDKQYEIYYRSLSSYAHPSYLGVLQFGQMYNKDVIDQFERTSYCMGISLSCKFAEFFAKSIEGGSEAYSSLSQNQQIIIKIGANVFPLSAEVTSNI